MWSYRLSGRTERILEPAKIRLWLAYLELAILNFLWLFPHFNEENVFQTLGNCLQSVNLKFNDKRLNDLKKKISKHRRVYDDEGRSTELREKEAFYTELFQQIGYIYSSLAEFELLRCFSVRNLRPILRNDFKRFHSSLKILRRKKW